MYKPTFAETIELSKSHNIIPISMTIPGDMTSPIIILKTLKGMGKSCFLFESVEEEKFWGRYSILGYDPVKEITCVDGKITISSNDKKTINDNPTNYLNYIINNFNTAKFDYLPPFTGGLVGYFAYDFIKYSEEKLNTRQSNSDDFNDMDLMLFNKVIVIDNLKQVVHLINNINNANVENDYQAAIEELSAMAEIIKKPKDFTIEEGKLKSKLNPLYSKNEYMNMVKKAKDYIIQGDIFQVVLSNKLEADFTGSLFETYRYLRKSNPSPYMFYMSSSKNELTGASPETLVKLAGTDLFTYPLAGTIKRGKTPEEDLANEKQLVADAKELAEHNMLVDLGRNDLGRISEFGSVEVKDYKKVLKFQNVMHLGSTVVGKIKSECNAIDAIKAVLPAGTLSGAPKIRACEIIEELEQNKRGVYGGAIGYIDYQKNMDTCIAIRLCYKKNNKIFVRAGAGIVYDSVPEKEYEEIINKSKSMVDAIENVAGDKK